MAGTTAGGRKARETNIKKYGADFYARIGKKGGKLGKTGGFAAGEAGRERARIYGAEGGRISKRGFTLINGQYFPTSERSKV